MHKNLYELLDQPKNQTLEAALPIVGCILNPK